MFKDSLQKRLYEMEQKNPSENKHKVQISKNFLDSFHFLIRYIRRSVVKYTGQMRRDEEQEKEKPGRDYFLLYRQAASCYPMSYARFARSLVPKELTEIDVTE